MQCVSPRYGVEQWLIGLAVGKWVEPRRIERPISVVLTAVMGLFVLKEEEQWKLFCQMVV